jgi:hypothetical protein
MKTVVHAVELGPLSKASIGETHPRMTPLRVVVFGCSSVTTGELTMALDFLRRCRQPLEVHALVGNGVMNVARWHGAQVHLYPSLGVGLALSKIESTLRSLQPDLLLVADLLLMYGLSPEFAANLSAVIPGALSATRVVALDLYDFSRTALDVDVFGRPLLAHMPHIPDEVGRLQPVPSLPPARSVSGVGRYPMVSHAGPLPQSTRDDVHERLGIPPDRAMVVITTSVWQHRLAERKESAAVATHFPALMYRYLDLAGSSNKVTVVHIGPTALPPPADLQNVTYQHIPSLPPLEFERVLGAADLFLSVNCPATSAAKAAALRVPVVTLFAPPAPSLPTLGSGPAREAYQCYAEHTQGGYPFYLWPVGLYGVLHRVLDGNPFTTTQRFLNIHQPMETVEGMRRLLAEPSEADGLRHAQEAYFARLARDVDPPDVALNAALREPNP